jgi:glutamate racemase
MTQAAMNPIGIFDSGMGGLTVAKTITTLLPHENIVYFGDTAHTPWGDKSVAAIQAYSLKICEVLLQHHCKVIVVACHTASTAAFELVKEYVGHKALVLNVVDPVVEHLKTHHANQKIGLIGTKQTIRSNTYQKRLDSLDQNIELAALATPLLVPLIEEGFSEHPISEMMIQEYLSHPQLQNLDALILGCTHYPLLKKHIQKFYPKKIDIIDASQMTAIVLKDLLSQHQVLNPKIEVVKKLFYISDYNDFFAATAKLFFPGEIKLEAYPLWE